MPLLRHFNADFGSSQTIDTGARQIWPKKVKQNAYYHKIFSDISRWKKTTTFYAFLNRFSYIRIVQRPSLWLPIKNLKENNEHIFLSATIKDRCSKSCMFIKTNEHYYTVDVCSRVFYRFSFFLMTVDPSKIIRGI